MFRETISESIIHSPRLPAVRCVNRRWEAGSRAEVGRQRDQFGPGSQRKQPHTGGCPRKRPCGIPENVLNACLTHLLLSASDAHARRRSLHTPLREGRVNPVPRAPTEALASAPKAPFCHFKGQKKKNRPTLEWLLVFFLTVRSVLTADCDVPVLFYYSFYSKNH